MSRSAFAERDLLFSTMIKIGYAGYRLLLKLSNRRSGSIVSIIALAALIGAFALKAAAAISSSSCRVRAPEGVLLLLPECQQSRLSTLGPKGRNVVMEKPFGAPRITKDGVTVAKVIDLADKFENLGTQLVREVASKQHDLANVTALSNCCIERRLRVDEICIMAFCDVWMRTQSTLEIIGPDVLE